MDYPNCRLRCNGMLNCQQLDHLIVELVHQSSREDSVDFYRAMLKRNYRNCPLATQDNFEQIAVSMY